jgi:ubiquinone/menaquinone biosynthesis C-methylase UbiE
MKNLKNWDNKTWLSSTRYISNIIFFLEKKINFNKEIKILDIGCGRGKIISALSKKYKMNNLPLGVDIVDHKVIEKKITYIKINALRYLDKTNKKFDLILFKQSIHFFKPKEINKILDLSKKKLNPSGKIMILTLHSKKNYWPLFKTFKTKLIKSLKNDELILNIIKSNLKKYKTNYFNFKVKTTKDFYIKMIKNRFTSCLLNFSHKELNIGIQEIKEKYKKKISFYDKLICITYKKK